ncbi:MAG: hypothetical protein IT165_01970 [Bryobacterales bacterium]|nr:hypothetical protein [Bryobacterales bacterium]
MKMEFDSRHGTASSNPDEAQVLWLNRNVAGIIPIGAVFALAGVYIAMEDTLEGAIPADIVNRANRGTAYGLMGAVNGRGDLIASALVGSVWTFISPALAFALAALLMLSGAALTYWNRPSRLPTSTAFHRGPRRL